MANVDKILRASPSLIALFFYFVSLAFTYYKAAPGNHRILVKLIFKNRKKLPWPVLLSD